MVEHPPVKRTVVGSNPAGSVLFVSHSLATPDTTPRYSLTEILLELVQFGRTLGLGPRGHWFKSSIPDLHRFFHFILVYVKLLYAFSHATFLLEG